MRDDEMKKRGTIAVIEGHGGSFVLDLSIPVPPPLYPHPDSYSPRAGRSKAASEDFIFFLSAGVAGLQTHLKLHLFSQIF